MGLVVAVVLSLVVAVAPGSARPVHDAGSHKCRATTEKHYRFERLRAFNMRCRVARRVAKRVIADGEPKNWTCVTNAPSQRRFKGKCNSDRTNDAVSFVILREGHDGFGDG